MLPKRSHLQELISTAVTMCGFSRPCSVSVSHSGTDLALALLTSEGSQMMLSCLIKPESQKFVRQLGTEVKYGFS